MLGNGIEVRTDRLALLILLMVLVSLAGASLGLLIAVLAPVQLLPVIFALVFTPLVFTGCALYSWSSLDKIHWFQVITVLKNLPTGGHATPGVSFLLQ
jgi:ABC-2 type transport system permease protein